MAHRCSLSKSALIAWASSAPSARCPRAAKAAQESAQLLPSAYWLTTSSDTAGSANRVAAS